MSTSEEDPATAISFRRFALVASASPPFLWLCALFMAGHLKKDTESYCTKFEYFEPSGMARAQRSREFEIPFSQCVQRLCATQVYIHTST